MSIVLASQETSEVCSRRLPIYICGVLTSCTVKTLAIRGTSEEVMVARSKALKENKQEFTKDITEDRTIRDFIEVRGTRTPLTICVSGP